MTFSSATHVDLPLGCYVLQEGEQYTLESPAVLTKQNTRSFEYQCTFSSAQERLKRYRFRNDVDGRLKFSLTAKPSEHLAMLIANLNRRESGWVAGSCIDDVETVISYNFNTCMEALDSMASTFETEWEIVGKTIHLKRVEYFKDSPLPLSYGKGNGFVSGVGRTNTTNEESGLELVYAIGGTRNVYPEQNNGGQADSVKGTDTELILPRSQDYEYGGKTYRTDEKGYYVFEKGKAFSTHKEGALDCSDIYPSRVGTISSVIAVDEGQNLYDFIDNSIPDDLDYEECLIEGEKMTVIFQDGMLAGKEFDANYTHSTRRFEIVPQDVDGVTMPNETFKPVAGGKYAVFNVKLPKSYVCDNAAKSGASWDMFRKAAEYLHDHSEYFFTFNGTLDKIWAKKNWESIKGKLILGGTVRFSDTQFQPQGIDIRITGIKQYINNPEAPELEISNASNVGQSFASQIGGLENMPVTVSEGDSANKRFTKRTFRDAKETMQALNDALESFKGEFTEGISPITINTMQLLVGSEQCQFEFVNSSGTVIDHDEHYIESSKKFYCASGRVRFQVGNDLSSEEGNWQYRDLSAYTSGTLDGTRNYYVYARCRKGTGTSVFNVQETPRDYDDGTYYNLLVGILDKEQFGNRTWSPMYGYTEITPGRMRVNKIISSDGQNYIDLVSNIMKLGESFVYNIDGDNKLRLYDVEVRGNIYTPMTVIMSSTWQNYLELEQTGWTYFIDWDKTGLNVQINYWPDVAPAGSTVTADVLGMPLGADYLGCEANIIMAIDAQQGRTNISFATWKYNDELGIYRQTIKPLTRGCYRMKLIDIRTLPQTSSAEKQARGWIICDYYPFDG